MEGFNFEVESFYLFFFNSFFLVVWWANVQESQQSKSAHFQPPRRATTNDILAKANSSLSWLITAAACSQSQQLGLKHFDMSRINQPVQIIYLILCADSLEGAQAAYRRCSRAITKDFPGSVTYLNHKPIYIWVVCGSVWFQEWVLKRLVFESDWIVCSKYDDHSRLNDQHSYVEGPFKEHENPSLWWWT